MKRMKRLACLILSVMQLASLIVPSAASPSAAAAVWKPALRRSPNGSKSLRDTSYLVSL